MSPVAVAGLLSVLVAGLDMKNSKFSVKCCMIILAVSGNQVRIISN